MSFLNPTYLWALLGLFVPIVIHLWSKKEGRTIKIGSIKLLSEAESKQTSSIKINELVLLLIRLLLITLLVLIIAGPRLIQKGNTVPVTYIIDSSLLHNEQLTTIIDTLETGSSLRLLQKDFPEYYKDELHNSINTPPNYWHLAKEMETLDTDSIVVFTNALASGIKGTRPMINRKINWVVLDPDENINEIIEVVKKENSVQLLSVLSDHHQLSFTKEEVSKENNELTFNKTNDSVVFLENKYQKQVPLTTQRSISVLIYYEDDFFDEMTYINASFKTISKYLDRPIELSVLQNPNNIEYTAYDLVVWLSNDLAPEITTKTLIHKPDILAQKIIETEPKNDLFYLTKTLNAENIIDEHLTEHLLKLLDLHKEMKPNLINYDKRIVSIEELLPVDGDYEINKGISHLQDISDWFWIVFLILLIAERIIAKLRKQ